MMFTPDQGSGHFYNVEVAGKIRLWCRLPALIEQGVGLGTWPLLGYKNSRRPSWVFQCSITHSLFPFPFCAPSTRLPTPFSARCGGGSQARNSADLEWPFTCCGLNVSTLSLPISLQFVWGFPPVSSDSRRVDPHLGFLDLAILFLR